MTRLKAKVTIFTPERAADTFKALIEPWEAWIDVQTLDAFGITDSLGWSGYNTLLKNADFWAQINTEQTLIFQPDSLLISPLNLEEINYSYAGSPWSKGKITSCEFPVYDKSLNWIGSHWANQALCQTVPDTTNNGNGGLSVRNTKVMQAICADHAQASPPQEAEDIFFARHVNSPEYGATLPSQSAIRKLFNESSYSDSCGFHGSWFYLDACEQAKLYEKHVKHVIGMLTALS